MKYIFITALFLFISSCMNSSMYTAKKLIEAEKYASEKKYDQAIEMYYSHMGDRLTDPDRPKSENPYFYLLLIGDMKLEQDKVVDAFNLYKAAQDKGVDDSLISDRYRSIAKWYESHGDLDQAFEILQKYNYLDSVLFGAMADRIARKMINLSDAKNL